MNAAQLLEHFDRLAEAPSAVARLRRFILDLAVRGKLVEQDAGDEPAAELLGRIEATKARFIKAEKFKRGDGKAPADNPETQFLVPLNWVWTQLGEVAQYGIADKVDSNSVILSSTWVLDLEDIEKDTSRLLNHIESEARPFSSTKTAFKQGDVLFGKLRPYLNKVIVADRDGVCTTEIIPIRGYCGLVPEYTKIVLRSPLTMATVDRLMYGMKMPRLGTSDATKLSYPLPPLAEQHRIVLKVDELMALCDQLEAAQQERERRRDRLASASLQRLNQPAVDATPETQREHARFHLHHLPRLTTRPEHIKAMRQTILYLAVHGKLVENELDQESVKDISVSVGQLTTSIVPQRDKPLSFTGDIPWVTLPCFRENATSLVLDYPHLGLTPEEVKQYRLRLVPAGSVLMSCVGRFGLAAVTDVDCVPNQQVHAFCVQPNLLIAKYLCYTIMAQKKFFEDQATKTTIAYLNKARCESLPINLPSLAEQHRIVAKVDELMALCDQLEAQLSTTQTDSRRLLEAVLEAALAPA